MSANPFDIWLGKHDAAFSGFVDWLGAVAGRLALWERHLGEFSLPELIAATDALALDREHPRSYSDHLAEIAWRCRSSRQAKSPPPTHLARCELCGGTGLVGVVPRHAGMLSTTRGATKEKPRPGAPLGREDRFAASCPCPRGGWYPAFPPLDRQTMETEHERFLATAKSPEFYAEWMAKRKAQGTPVTRATLLKGAG